MPIAHRCSDPVAEPTRRFRDGSFRLHAGETSDGYEWDDPPSPRRRVAMTAPTLYVSRRVCLPPIVAATAFDVLHLAAAEHGDPTMWTLESPRALLVLNEMRLLPDHPTLPLRQAPGRLRATPVGARTRSSSR